MRTSTPISERRPASRELVLFQRTIVFSRVFEGSFGDVERAIRICLNAVGEAGLRSSGRKDGSTLGANVHGRPITWWIREPVDVTIKRARRSPGLVAHLRWLPQHPKVLAVMEANLLVRRGRGSCVEFILDCSYSPPSDGLGFGSDLLARSVAQSTAESFIDGLGHAVEDNLQHPTMTRNAENLEALNVKAPPGGRRWTSDLSRWRWRKATGSPIRSRPMVLTVNHRRLRHSGRSFARCSLKYCAAPRPTPQATIWPTLNIFGGSSACSSAVLLNEPDLGQMVRR
jgi:hypothetical protein